MKDDWMLPSAALDRFVPPAEMLLAETIAKEVVRYGFKIGELGFLIQSGSSSEVMHMPAIWTIPGAPPWFLGLINLRGNLVPVYELRVMLSLSERQAEIKPQVLVFEQGDKAVGLLIDEFPKPLADLESMLNLPILPTVLNGHVRRGYLAKGENIWLEFDHISFFEELVCEAPS